MAAKKREAAAPATDAVLDAIRTKHGAEAVIRLGAHTFQKVETTSAGALSLDVALGGGYARGRIVEIFGPESSGKTTLALHAIAEIQKLDEQAAFVDAEHALDPRYAAALGVDLQRLLFAQPKSGEDALDLVESLAATGDVSLVVVDSVAALTPLAELETESVGDQQIGAQARLMSRALRRLCGVASKKRCTLLFLNQLRQKIGVLYGNPETTPGGNALKYYASQRVDVRRSTHVKEGDEAVGNVTKIKIVKNKVAPPFGATELTIRWGHGIDRAADLLEAAVTLGVVEKAGAWFSFGDEKLAQGANSSAKRLGEDAELGQRVYTATRAKMEGNG